MTTVTPDARTVWRAARAPVAVAAVIVAIAIVLALAQGTSSGGELDPNSARPDGTRALAQLLDDHGVAVDATHTAADATSAVDDAAATAAVVVHPHLVPDAELRRITGGAEHVVLVAPDAGSAAALLRGSEPAGTPDEQERAPECALPAAEAAGNATTGGRAYRADGATACYPADDGAVLLQAQQDGRTITVLGTPTPLTNEAIGDAGNAALGLNLLGTHDRLVWYVPSSGDPAFTGEQQPLTALLPDAWTYGVLQLAIAAVLVALWRARRLGPVVHEPLPVVVHAAETTEGRALLYQRSGAVEHAASTLRQATARRLASALGLAMPPEPESVVAAAVTATGRAPEQIRPLLYGQPPQNEAALVRLADELDELQRQVEQAAR